ncbi:hypothetical protein BC827DRAFT_1170377 [Russula dissimulans]|nr:hypothetical protein BC827DRAFT_1170377 [Russula dissimulans]
METSDHSMLALKILCNGLDWQLSSLAQVCSSALPSLPTVTLEHLTICEDSHHPPHWQDDIEDIQWLELLQPFTGVKKLYLSEEFALRIALILQELTGERAIEMLPALQDLFIENPLPSTWKAIGLLNAARKRFGHPITVSQWYAGPIILNLGDLLHSISLRRSRDSYPASIFGYPNNNSEVVTPGQHRSAMRTYHANTHLQTSPTSAPRQRRSAMRTYHANTHVQTGPTSAMETIITYDAHTRNNHQGNPPALPRNTGLVREAAMSKLRSG